MVRGIFALILLLATGCQGVQFDQLRFSPAISGEAEALLGRQAACGLEQRFGGLCEMPALERRMRQIGGRLAAATPELNRAWLYRVLDSDKVNAFSLPGGLIYITRGLYERRVGEDNALLAAVIAHEMGHVVRRDSLRPHCGSACESLRREIGADACGARYLAAAGYDVECLDQLLRLIKDIQPEGWATARVNALKDVALAPAGKTMDRFARR